MKNRTQVNLANLRERAASESLATELAALILNNTIQKECTYE